MDIIEAIKTRRSIRKFDIERQVDDRVLMDIIECASWAPSAHNEQPWKFIIFRDKEKMRKIAERYVRASNFLIHTPAAIAVVADFRHIRKADGDKVVKYYSTQDTAAAIQNILLAAWSFGLGTCWIGDFDELQLREMFNIPEGYNAVGVIAIGYPRPGKKFPVPRRKPLEEIMSFEKF